MLVALNERECVCVCVCVNSLQLKFEHHHIFVMFFSVTIISFHMFYVLLLYIICWQKMLFYNSI